MNLFPPILESQRESLPMGNPASGQIFEIPFTMPLATVLSEIKHVQVIIRRQANMESWVSQDRSSYSAPVGGRLVDNGITKFISPDREVLYMSRDAIRDKNVAGDYTMGLHPTNTALDKELGLYYLVIPRSGLAGAFQAGDSPADLGETYTIQIRFGTATLFNNATDFASWRITQTNDMAFGEWSNTQRMFVHGGFTLTTNIKPSPIGGLNWSYVPKSNDPLSQVRITYSWSTPDDDAYGNMYRAKNLDFESHDGTGARAAGDIDLGVMRFAQITVGLTLTTINNTIISKVIVIPAFTFSNTTPVFNGYLRQQEVTGAEIDDGVLAIALGWNQTTTTRLMYYNVYRVNLRTLETILLTNITPSEMGVATATRFDTVIKDYSVEMGEEFVYYCAAFNSGGVYQYSLIWDGNLTPNNWKPHLYPGYGRQMNFEGNTFLTTKWGQLRLQGNVQVSGFQRQTSDQFTTTIGGEYPFYSRSAQFNYRTLSLQTLISMNFDPTNTFLRFRTQLASVGMVAAINGVESRFQDSLQAITNWFNTESAKAGADIPALTIERNRRVALALDEYYAGLENVYRGVSPTTGEPFADLPNGPLWMTGQLWQRQNQDRERLILRDTELFSNYQFSNSVARYRDTFDADNETLMRSDDASMGLIRGATTRFADRKLRDATHVLDSGRTSDIIYAERKFRDAVMVWLSDGQPKLFRSETEGNMIVMLSGISFTPFNKSRQLYSLSCTVTEVAEYNLSNLILYGLVPVKFEPTILPTNDIIFGDLDNSFTKVYVSPTDKVYPSAVKGYVNTIPSLTQVFTVNNPTTQTLTGVSAFLRTGTHFQISTALTPTTIGFNGKATVSVRPKSGLAPGAYADKLVIDGVGGVGLEIPISFKVTET